ESFWSHMKEEYFRFYTSNTKQELIDNIAEFMSWYNNERRQSTLKGMTPKEFRNHASKNIA
ncbi:IS3 family transposase, partial [Amylolactobacillus amylophilus]